jgi:hypothetical protein
VKKNAENSSTLVAQNVNSQDLKIRCSRLTDSQPAVYKVGFARSNSIRRLEKFQNLVARWSAVGKFQQLKAIACHNKIKALTTLDDFMPLAFTSSRVL